MTTIQMNCHFIRSKQKNLMVLWKTRLWIKSWNLQPLWKI